MATELKRGFVRIASNYAQLAGGLVLGIMLVPLILEGMGTEAFGFIGVVGGAIGITHITQGIVNRSLIQELAAAHHDPDPDRFVRTYNAALRVSAAISLLSLGLFGVLAGLVGFLNIPDRMLYAARWYVMLKGLESAVLIAAGPARNMYMVTERMIAHNFCVLIQNTFRPLAAAMLVFVVVLPLGPSLIFFAAVDAGLNIVLILAMSAAILNRDRRLVPSPGKGDRAAIAAILTVGGPNLMMVMANNLHLRIAQIVMNLYFGLLGNAFFEPAVRLGSYLQRAAMGVTRGSQAVAARINTTGEIDEMQHLLRATTRLHGLVAIPALAYLLILAHPLVDLWIGGRVDDPQTIIPHTVTLVRILAVGFAARALAKGWEFVFYGAGHVRRYAWLVLLGGILGPALGIGLIYLLPQPVSYTGPAWAFAAIVLITMFLATPLVTLSVLEVRYLELLGALGRPLLVTVLASSILVGWQHFNQDWTFLDLLAVSLAYAAALFLLTVILAINHDERRRFALAIKRRLTSKGTEGRRD